ncbi:MAG TPA: D-alanyl-D-alanine carboxypeptidase family protein [Vineibacter sp.]|nr:D-alanyl-D-alanine carboxypeptidase family protein [Vineibacter sp.]
MPSVKLPPLFLSGSVGVGGANRPTDVKAVQNRLQYVREQSVRQSIPLRRPDYAGMGSRGMTSRIADGACDEITVGWIKEFQSIFLRNPDGQISPGGHTSRFLSRWEPRPISSKVVWTGRLGEAWLLMSPLLPEGSRCTSAYRSVDDQKRVIDNMFKDTYGSELKAKLGVATYDAILASTDDKRYPRMVKELRGLGQDVATPGTSPHQFGKAIDIGGPKEIDDEQVRVARMVGTANNALFSGKILKERNGCVHVEIR